METCEFLHLSLSFFVYISLCVSLCLIHLCVQVYIIRVSQSLSLCFLCHLLCLIHVLPLYAFVFVFVSFFLSHPIYLFIFTLRVYEYVECVYPDVYIETKREINL